MKLTRAFLSNSRATSAAEFALVLPLFLLLLLGTIDIGRWMWNIGQLEKATMMGTRYAVVTDLVPSGLRDYSFAVSGNVPQGNVVPESQFPGVVCIGAAGGTASCQCLQSQAGSCNFDASTSDDEAFGRIVGRMQRLYGGIGPQHVQIAYTYSGLGYAGDPNGPDVAPIITVSLRNLPFRPISLGLLADLGLPGTSHSLTMEDGIGSNGY